MINYNELEYNLGTLGHSGFCEVASLKICLVWTSLPAVHAYVIYFSVNWIEFLHSVITGKLQIYVRFMC